MKLFPGTLGGRMLLLVIAAVLLSAGATFGVFGYFRDRVVEQRGAERVVGYVRLMQSALEAMSPGERREFASRALAIEGVRVVSDADAEVSDRELGPPRHPEFATRVRAELGEDTQVRALPAAEGSPRELWVSFSAAGDKWWLVQSFGRLEIPLPSALIGILAAVVAAGMVFGAGFVRSIVRPLRDLEDATGALGAGRPRPVTPAGPQETQVLAERFNVMLEQLERNEREHNVMLAGLPHDLRAPLTRLRLRLAMLDAETRSGIQRDTEDIERIASQFIAYLRGADRSAQRRERLPLLEFVEDRAARYRKLGRNVIARGDASVMVSADAEAIARLLDNLIDNALRYGAEPVELEVSAKDGEAKLTVRDHGPGIPPQERERALQPFTRLDAARGGGGSCGLGLAIVERIARGHGGKVSLATGEGAGLAVDVTLQAGE